MFESLVITLRKGIEAALVVGIILAYLKKTERQILNKYVRWGLASGIIASIAGAVVMGAIGVEPENKVYEGLMYLTDCSVSQDS